MKIKQIILVLVFLILIPASLAHAHKVIIFAWVEDGMIFSESHFGSDRKAKNCKVSVVNEKGEQVYAGMTDEQGSFSFKIPENIDSYLILNLDAGQGHSAYWKLSEDELQSSHSQDDIKTAMEMKEKFEQTPSVYKILSGIGIIFLFFFALKLLKKRQIQNSD